MKSMTGYGKGVSEREGKTLTVEIKAVNNRFLEISSRIPKFLGAGEEIVRKEIASVIKRGSIDLTFDYRDFGSNKKLQVDYELAALYSEAANDLSKKLGIENGLDAALLLKYSDVVTVTADYETEILLEMLEESTKQALKALDAMRIREGEGTKKDLLNLIGNISAHREEVKARAPFVVADYREKLRKRIEEFLGEIEPDETKLLNEVAFFADKVDINEEISRLGSHIEQFLHALNEENEVGRRLEFLAQEMNREINTMGSKSSDVIITSHVLGMKNELEKIREQTRNIE